MPNNAGPPDHDLFDLTDHPADTSGIAYDVAVVGGVAFDLDDTLLALRS